MRPQGPLTRLPFACPERSNSILDRLNNHLFFSFYLLTIVTYIWFIHPLTATLNPEEKSRRKDKWYQGGRQGGAGRQGGKKVSTFPIFSYCVESLQKLLKNRGRTNIKKFNTNKYIQNKNGWLHSPWVPKVAIVVLARFMSHGIINSIINLEGKRKRTLLTFVRSVLHAHLELIYR